MDQDVVEKHRTIEDSDVMPTFSSDEEIEILIGEYPVDEIQLEEDAKKEVTENQKLNLIDRIFTNKNLHLFI
jgi:hypothetical protein